jgi:hypothetical protein
VGDLGALKLFDCGVRVLANYTPIGEGGLVVCFSIARTGVLSVVDAEQIEDPGSARQKRGHREQISGCGLVHGATPLTPTCVIVQDWLGQQMYPRRAERALALTPNPRLPRIKQGYYTRNTM